MAASNNENMLVFKNRAKQDIYFLALKKLTEIAMAIHTCIV